MNGLQICPKIKLRTGKIIRLLLQLLALHCFVFAASADEPIQVVTSVPPQAYFVERIGKDDVSVQVLIPPAANPTTYEPSAKQLVSIKRAQLFVKVGHEHFPFERVWGKHLLAGNDQMRVLDSSAGVELFEHDPHVWLSPSAMRQMVRRVAGVLSEIRPESAAMFDANLKLLLTDIDTVDNELRTLFGRYTNKEFLVFHPAWGYLARDYGLTQLSVEHGGKEPSLAELARIVKEAKSSGISTVFIEPQFSQQSAKVVADELGAKIQTIDPLAKDWVSNLRYVGAELARSFEK